MTRRDLGKIALFQAAVANAQTAKPATKYKSALDGFESKVDPNNFDPIHYTNALYDAAPLRMTFQAKTRRQAEQWQARLRPKIAELVGGFPEKRSPLEPQTLEVRDFPGYRREKFVFQSRPGAWVLAYALVPTAGKAPHATMVCVPGHGRGVDDIVGIDDKGNDRANKDGYQ